jgi:RNA polymerase sigma factor (sigma-70 family)
VAGGEATATRYRGAHTAAMAGGPETDIGGARLEPTGSVRHDTALAYLAHAAEIRAYLLRCTRDPAIADDLTQEAFLRLCLEVRAGRTPTNVRAWLYRVARNLAASRGRHQGVTRRWLQGQPREEPRTEALECLVLLHDRGDRIEIAMDALPDRTREALLLAASGFSGREIARRLRRSEVATRTLLCRGRSRLRLLLADDVPSRAGGPRRQGQGRYARVKGAGARSAGASGRATIGR